MENIHLTFEKAFDDRWQKIISAAPDFIQGLVLFILIAIAARLLRKILKKQLLRKVEDQLFVNFIVRTVYSSLLIVGIFVFMRQLGWTQAVAGLLAGAGVSAIVLGFAFKDIGENFIAGFFLAFSRPFSIGDRISIDGVEGSVRKLDYRTTHLRTADGRDVYVPNAQIVKDKLTNFTRDGLLRHDFTIGVDYGASADECIQIILDVIIKTKGVDNNEARKPFVIIDNLGSSTLDLKGYYWTNSSIFLGSIMALKSDIIKTALLELTAAGINMPSPIVELKSYDQEGFVLKSPLQVAQ